MPDFQLESNLTGRIAGIDEAGRGPWAGPVSAAAVVLDQANLPDALRDGLDDSKKLSPRARDALFDALHEQARLGNVDIGVGLSSVAEIERDNILAATMTAMARAVTDLDRPVDIALVDGNRVPNLTCTVQTVVKGDQRSLSIAAASIIAKVTRDWIMAELDAQHPGYGWAHNAGYGTAEHRAALLQLGVTPHHRRSFKPIAALLK
ncbi:MAG: ribonuclease HII [Alphaproteobacteria bacterium]|nr:ribonuclease HII [Alphaproteobacteria bacterium]